MKTTKRVIDQETYRKACKLFDAARRAHDQFIETQNHLILDVLGLEDHRKGDHVYETITRQNGITTFEAALAKEGVKIERVN